MEDLPGVDRTRLPLWLKQGGLRCRGVYSIPGPQHCGLEAARRSEVHSIRVFYRGHREDQIGQHWAGPAVWRGNCRGRHQLQASGKKQRDHSALGSGHHGALGNEAADEYAKAEAESNSPDGAVPDDYRWETSLSHIAKVAAEARSRTPAQ